MKKNKLKQKQPKKRVQRHKRFIQKLTFVGTNCAGLSSKWQSFNKLIDDIKPAVFFGQETKLNKKQKFKVNNSQAREGKIWRWGTGHRCPGGH